ncbi:DUF4124 domain-containing protein [Xanthomonas sp. WHRI 1810A]|uniref:DUF4124 domain-containing protein n=1 Tax=Xanthomonas sp. WHRI 1810A TaxID=3161565 RepID=UPI0032E86912
MPSTRHLLISALLLLPIQAVATTVHRCEDSAGKITFTTLGCPLGQTVQAQEAFNAPPGTPAIYLPPAEGATRITRTPAIAPKELVVVGQHDDGCGSRLSADQRRRAIINLQTPAGMTKRDVESMLGKPDKIISRNGEVRYVYNEKKGRSSQVTFDEDGCVKGKR